MEQKRFKVLYLLRNVIDVASHDDELIKYIPDIKKVHDDIFKEYEDSLENMPPEFQKLVDDNLDKLL